jgi:hypothetical protein
MWLPLITSKIEAKCVVRVTFITRGALDLLKKENDIKIYINSIICLLYFARAGTRILRGNPVARMTQRKLPCLSGIGSF